MTQVALPDLTVSTGESASNAIGGDFFEWLQALTIFAPDSLAGTVTVEVAAKDPEDAVDVDFKPYQEDGADLTIPAGTAVTVTPVSFKALRVAEGTSPGADEDFEVVGDDESI